MARLFVAASTQHLKNANAVVTAMPVTLACWFKATSTIAHGLINIGVSTNNTNLFSLNLTNTSNVRAVQNGNRVATTSATFTNGTWNHACGQLINDSSRAVFLNGGNKATNTTTSSATSGLNKTSIGVISGNSDTQLADAAIAEVGIWNVALDDSEVAALGKGVSPLLVRPQSLVAYWPLIGRTSPEIDVRGGFGMTVTGATVADHPRIYYPTPKHFVLATAANAYTLTAGTGAFTLAGKAAGLTAARLLPAAVGAFSLIGKATGLYAWRLVSAGTGAFTLTGKAAGLYASRTVSAGTGSFALAGNAANLLATRVVAAAVGVFTLTGSAAGLRATRVVSAETGTFTLAGKSAGLYVSRVVSAGAGSFTLTGRDAALLAARRLSADCGPFTLTGRDANLLASRILSAGCGAFTLTGHDANLVYQQDVTPPAPTPTTAGGGGLAGIGSLDINVNDDLEAIALALLLLR